MVIHATAGKDLISLISDHRTDRDAAWTWHVYSKGIGVAGLLVGVTGFTGYTFDFSDAREVLGMDMLLVALGTSVYTVGRELRGLRYALDATGAFKKVQFSGSRLQLCGIAGRQLSRAA